MKRILNTTTFFACLLSLLAVTAANAADIEPPKTQVVDKFGVNMANGQVTHSLNTVSIGGAMGLSHSVSVFANEFNYPNYRGFQDKYTGDAREISLSDQPYYHPLNILRVHDFTGSADFGYIVNGSLADSGGVTSGYSYQSMGDERQILEYYTDVVSGQNVDYLRWIHPDGTVSRFNRGSTAANAFAALVDVTFPNGFVIRVASGMGATTNTGFEIKALYQPDYSVDPKPPLPNCGSLQNHPAPYSCLYNAPPMYSADDSAHHLANPWSTSNPKYIMGINNAYEYCDPIAATCTLARAWPKATFNWPAGMPRTMFMGTTTMNFIDAKGQTTTYTFKAYDANKNGSAVEEGYIEGIDWSPRLVSIAPYGTSQVFTYDYKNVWSIPTCINAQASADPHLSGQNFGCWDVRLTHGGQVTSATKMSLATGYDMNEPYYSDTINYAYGLNGVSRVQLHGMVRGIIGALYFVYTDDGVLTYEGTPRNFLTHFENYNGPSADYTYTRSNLTTISYYQGDTTVVATYPASCDANTRKTCNQATSIKDARGNYTYYWYHAPSGQVASIQYPANKHGVKPQVRNEYTQLSAHYFAGGSSKITGAPIWMKTAERICTNSNTTYDPNTGAGSCQGGASDEVVTRYEYNNDNLLMTGSTVTAWDPVTATTKTLRTCFKYDIYGNQIGKTQPKANLTQCN